jgi:hypothetical protein
MPAIIFECFAHCLPLINSCAICSTCGVPLFRENCAIAIAVPLIRVNSCFAD